MNDISDISNIVIDIDSNILFLSIIFGIIGMGYFSYGRNQNYGKIFFYSGIGLMIFPYFVDSESSIILVGIFLIIIPFIIRR